MLLYVDFAVLGLLLCWISNSNPDLLKSDYFPNLQDGNSLHSHTNVLREITSLFTILGLFYSLFDWDSRRSPIV